jgi:hypothetical protein
MIEVLMQVRKDKYKDNSPKGLDSVEEDEHQIQLDEELDVQDTGSLSMFETFFFRWLDYEVLTFLLTDIFKFNPKYRGEVQVY